MNKSPQRPGPESRRFSQPVLKGGPYGNAPPMGDRGRRTSELGGSVRGGDGGLPPGAGSLVAQFDDKIVGRKGRAKDNDVTFDPDQYNPDGSLRTVHRMPKFDEAYGEATKARYVRHPVKPDREKELSVKQIFEKQ